MIKYPLCFHHASSVDKTQSMCGTARCCHAARLWCLLYESTAQSRVRAELPRCCRLRVLGRACGSLRARAPPCASITKSQSSCSGCATVAFQGKWRKGKRSFPNWKACQWRKMPFEGSGGRRGIMLVRVFQRQGKKTSLAFNSEFHVQGGRASAL